MKSKKIKPVKYLNLKDRIALLTALDYYRDHLVKNEVHSIYQLPEWKPSKYVKYLISLRKKL